MLVSRFGGSVGDKCRGGRGGGTLCIYGRRVARDRPGASMAVLVVIFCDRFSHMSSY